MATLTIMIPIDCYKGKQLYQTIVITLTGPGTAKTAPTALASTIYGHGKVEDRRYKRVIPDGEPDVVVLHPEGPSSNGRV